MKEKIDSGYKLPENLIEVMDLASLLYAKMNDLLYSEKSRLVKIGLSSAKEIKEDVGDLNLTYNDVCQAVYHLGDYVGSITKMEMYEKQHQVYDTEVTDNNPK